MRSLFACFIFAFFSVISQASDSKHLSLSTNPLDFIDDTLVIALQENHKDSAEARRVLEQLSHDNRSFLENHELLGPDRRDKYMFNQKFSKTNWQGLSLDGALFINCSFEENSFSEGGVFENTTFMNCRFNQCTFKDYRLLDCNFLSCQFSDTIIRNGVINNCLIVSSIFNNIKFYKLNIDICTLIKCEFHGTVIERCYLKSNYMREGNFDEQTQIFDCQIQKTTMENSRIREGKIAYSKLEQISFKNSFLLNIKWDLNSLTLDKIDVSGCSFKFINDKATPLLETEAFSFLTEIPGLMWQEQNPPTIYPLGKRRKDMPQDNPHKKKK